MLTLLYFSLIAVPALLAVRRQLLRLRKGDEDRCRRCMYNLTGNVTGRCPECGGLRQDVGVQKGTPALSERSRRIVDITLLALVSIILAIWLLLALVCVGVVSFR